MNYRNPAKNFALRVLTLIIQFETHEFRFIFLKKKTSAKWFVCDRNVTVLFCVV